MRDLTLSGAGNSLTVTATKNAVSAGDVSYNAVLAVDAHPFSGAMREAYFPEDLVQWADSLRQLQVPGRVVLGSDRTAKLVLELQNR